MKKLISLLLVVIMCFSLVACGTNEPPETIEDATEADFTLDVEGDSKSSNILGEGATSFTVITTDLEGNETTFTVNTDEATVGEALIAVGLIEGHKAEYGLYIDAVNGIPLNWDKDGKYWAFYIDGEYALTGVDSTDVTAGATYTFRAE